VVAAVPALERAHLILDHIARTPHRSFSAAELGAAVGIHRATAHSILSCLAGLGLVHRDPATKTFRLGPELVRLGVAAADQYDGIEEARRELHQLARDLDVGGLVCVVVGDQIVIPERIGGGDAEYGMPPAERARVPLAPPIGAIFYAWASAEEIETWLSRAPDSASKEDIESFRRSVPAVRARGYSIGSDVEFELQLEEVLAGLGDRDASNRLTLALQLADLVRAERQSRGRSAGSRRDPRDRPIGHLIGPVFDADGRVVMTLTIFGRPGQISERNVDTYARPLVAASDRVTIAVGGRQPLAARHN
jgi:DNA-binding IclR family transcriptional regulator